MMATNNDIAYISFTFEHEDNVNISPNDVEVEITVSDKYKIAEYKFNNTLYDLIPEFNAEFTDYTYEDENAVYEIIISDFNWELGGIDGNTGENTEFSDSTIYRNGNYIEVIPNTIIRVTPNSGQLLIDWYDENKIFISQMDRSLVNEIDVPDNAKYFRIWGGNIRENITELRALNSMVTRTIYSTELPTLMRFGNESGSANNFSNSLLEVMYLNTSKVTTMTSMFNNCNNLTSLDVSNFNTSNVTNMLSMFENCNKLTQLDVSNFDTSNVTNMGYMFDHCNSLTSLDLSNWDTSNVTNMRSMFCYCNNLTTLDVSNFNTSIVNNMDSMFYYCNNLTTLDVSNWNTSNVTNMSFMFVHCNSLTSLDLSNWDTSNVTVMRNMFYGCKSLTSLDVSNFNTSKVTTMNSMFYNCNKLTSLDLSNFNTINVTNSTSMFEGCNALKYIGMLYSDKNSCNKIKDELPDITGLKRAIYVQDTKFYEYENTNYLEFRDYKEQKIIVYLPQPLRSIGEYKDKFYWDEGKGKYCIEQWVAIPEGYNETLNESLILETPIIIETDITEKINFDTTISYIQVITDEYKIQPSNITIEASMAEKIEGEGE